VRSVRLGNFNHSFPDDVDVVLVSPSGTAVLLMSDAGGGTDAVGVDYVLDDAAAATLADNALSPSGTYKPTNYGTPDAFAAPGPGAVSQANPTLASFGSGNHNGTWRLYVVDDASGDAGYIGNWTMTFDIPPTVVFSPITGLYTDPAATIPYTGTPITVVYAKPTTTTTYTATSTVDGCTGTNTITVTVNQLPAITVEPAPATQTICPGFNVVYTVTATGTGLTYQWRRNGVNLADNAQVSGSTTNTLTITNVAAANAGTYTVVVSGTCPPALTSANAVLNIGTTPVISSQPANSVKCVGQTATFTVGTTGSVPPPTIFQWQVSTDGGSNWTDLTTNGSYTATLTVPNVTLAMNNYRYRVIVTNSCGQTITSNAAILTVTNPNVTVQPLGKICLTDTLVPLIGTPVGGSWSGIGVSGFNFVPSATAVGTFTLTYSYTDLLGCTSSATTVAKVEDCPERLRLLRDDGVIIFPNPNNGQFNIKINSSLYNFLGMRVYDTWGRQLLVRDWSDLVFGRVVPVDLTHLPSGTYMVKLYYDDGVRSSEKTFPVIIAR
jgi:subtilisin-like proprotein convertase family protein